MVFIEPCDCPLWKLVLIASVCFRNQFWNEYQILAAANAQRTHVKDRLPDALAQDLLEGSGVWDKDDNHISGV